MTYGVKIIHTYVVGNDEQRFYEEIILKVTAASFDEAFDKAETYMSTEPCEYTNTEGKTVKTLKIEAVQCFEAFESEGDVQEIFSAFSVNRTRASEEDYYAAISDSCDEADCRPLRNAEFN